MTLARRPRLPAPTLFAGSAQARHALDILSTVSPDGVASTDLRRNSLGDRRRDSLRDSLRNSLCNSLRAGLRDRQALARRCAGTPIDRASGDVPIRRHSHTQQRNVPARVDKVLHFFQAGRQ